MRQSDITYITDIHLSSKKNPIWLVGDFFDTQMDRLEQAISISNQKGSNYFISGGDLFDTFQDLTPYMIFRILNSFHQLNSKFYTVVGNHDIQLSNEESLKQSAIGVLNMLLDHNLFNFPKDDKYLFHPISWYDDDLEKLMSGQFELPKSDKINVVIAHAPISAETTPNSLGIKDVRIKGVDYLLLGDQHEGHDPYKTDSGCVIINPGSFTATKKSEAKREKKVCLIKEDQYDYLSVDGVNLIEEEIIKNISKLEKVQRKDNGFEALPDLVRKVGDRNGYCSSVIEGLITLMLEK